MLCTQAVESRGPDALRAELLVGFDPLPHLLSALEDRLGKGSEGGGLLAAVCADATSGQQVVGIKWAPEAFVPAPPKVCCVHCVSCGCCALCA